MAKPPVKTMTLELHVDRGEEEIRCHRFTITFNEEPTPETAEPFVIEVFGQAITVAMEAVTP